MSSKNKNFRKSLKAPDQFQTSVASGFERALEYKTALIGLVTVVCLAIAGIAGWQHYQKQSIMNRANALGEIEQQYLKIEKDIEKQKNDIQEEIAALSEPGPDGKPKELDAAAKKKKAELEATAKKLKPNYEPVLPAYKKYFTDNLRNPEGWMAGLRAVSILVDAKQFDESAEILTTILKESKDVDFYQIKARFLLVNVYDEIEKLDDAMEVANQLDGLVSEELKPQVLLTKGRILLRKNEKEKADAIFKEIQEKHEGSQEAKMARSYRAILIN